MTIVDYALTFLGHGYRYGGDGSLSKNLSFDCSGLIIECLQAFDLLPNGDWTADALSKKLKKDGWKEVKDFQAGDIVFFHNGTKYTHVAMMINEFQYIEAGGGGSKCTSEANSTGMIRLRPLSWRKPSLILRKNHE